jgi:hypothetical protein
MVKILIIKSWLHEKNKQGLATMLNYLVNSKQIEYKVGNVNDIPNYDIIYSSCDVINTANYPDKKFIFGPHFSTFPNHHQLQTFQTIANKNGIYIQPSEWSAQCWRDMGAEQFLPIKSFPFPVNTNKFCPKESEKKENIMVYFKRRTQQELEQIKTFLAEQNINNYRIFSCDQRYNEDDYLGYLQTSAYGFLLDAHESQGFAIEEALACDVPLLVWNVQTMNQENGSSYEPISCSSIPYWDSRCGEVFHQLSELPAAFQTFQTKLTANTYQPRQYILDNLSTEKCAERFMELIKF